MVEISNFLFLVKLTKLDSDLRPPPPLIKRNKTSIKSNPGKDCITSVPRTGYIMLRGGGGFNQYNGKHTLYVKNE